MMDEKLKQQLIRSDSPVSSQRWAFMHYTKVSVFCAIIGFLAWIILPFFNKTLDLMSLGGFLGVIIGLSGAAKVSQSFAENGKTAKTETKTETKKEDDTTTNI